MKVRLSRWVEFLLLFAGVPLLIWMDEDFIHPSILILPVLGFIFIYLHRSSDFHWKELIRWGIGRSTLLRQGALFLIASLAVLGYVYFFKREQLFDLPRNNLPVYLGMCLFYPLFSAYGQEIIYRTFLKRRYGPIFPKPLHFILASATAFSFMHIVYYHPLSLVLTFIGGLYFASIYERTRSLLFCAVLHGLYGIMMFGLGLGRYFWLDMQSYF